MRERGTEDEAHSGEAAAVRDAPMLEPLSEVSQVGLEQYELAPHFFSRYASRLHRPRAVLVAVHEVDRRDMDEVRERWSSGVRLFEVLEHRVPRVDATREEAGRHS